MTQDKNSFLIPEYPNPWMNWNEIVDKIADATCAQHINEQIAQQRISNTQAHSYHSKEMTTVGSDIDYLFFSGSTRKNKTKKNFAGHYLLYVACNHYVFCFSFFESLETLFKCFFLILNSALHHDFSLMQRYWYIRYINTRDVDFGSNLCVNHHDQCRFVAVPDFSDIIDACMVNILKN